MRSTVKDLLPYSPISLLPSKKAAFTKPGRATSASESRVCVNGNVEFSLQTRAVAFNARRSLKQPAFTLAEVLVTLGIIGVVSAITVPTLMKNHQRKVYVTQLHKVYNEIQQALEMIMTDKNAINLSEARLINGSEETFLKEYFKVVKDCGSGSGNVTPCFASVSDYKYISGGAITDDKDWLEQGYKVSLANGASLNLDIDGSHGGTGSFTVDINGSSGPNIACRDLFIIFFNADGTIRNSNCIGRLMENGWQMDVDYDTNSQTSF